MHVCPVGGNHALGRDRVDRAGLDAGVARAWVVIVDGDVEVTSAGGGLSGGFGLSSCSPRPSATKSSARSDRAASALLTPRPGPRQPWIMTVSQKLYARRRAAKRRAQ